MVLVVKNLPASAGNPRDTGLIPGLGRSPGEGNDYSSIVAWRIPWTEEPGGLQSLGLQRVGHNWATNIYVGEEKGACVGSQGLGTRFLGLQLPRAWSLSHALFAH